MNDEKTRKKVRILESLGFQVYEGGNSVQLDGHDFDMSDCEATREAVVLRVIRLSRKQGAEHPNIYNY